MGLLSLAIWTPIFFGVVLLALGRDEQARAVRWLALTGAVFSFLVTLPLYTRFELGTPAMQFVENLPWIARFNVNYHLGLDGISLWFVLLTAFINIIVVIASWESITRRVNQYMGAFMILSGLMIGVFAALDGLLFFVFFEATLIPMYLIIGIWGGPNKIYAAFKLPPLPSRCPCGRSTPGCPMCTWKRPPAARPCWPPSCSSSARMAFYAFRFPSRRTLRMSGPG
jgi:NADH-quinone oxidoreductase subunit M